jgi:hypothetical protein
MEGDTGTEGAPPAFDAASASKRLSNFLSYGGKRVGLVKEEDEVEDK